MTTRVASDTELVQRAWAVVFPRAAPENAAEVALFQHLQSLVASVRHPETDGNTNTGSHNGSATTTSSSSTSAGSGVATEECIVQRLREDLEEKLRYLDPCWGYIDAARIVSRVDECALALQEKPKKAFLDPLHWDLQPHASVVATVKSVLLLFGMPIPSHLTDDALWSSYWALWLVKNIDAHTGGWEWATTNEPTGLFTKPYALSAAFLPQVRHFLATTSTHSQQHRCWHRMDAYACLRDWAEACVDYVHVKHHYLPEFPAFAEVAKLLAPPRRTPQANVWFKLTTAEGGIEYYYNRVLQEIFLEEPEDFDGMYVATIPSTVMELVEETLRNDHATRLELERRIHQKVHDALLAEDEWVQCVDYRTQQHYYYSFRHYRVSDMPPVSGVFLVYTESTAYRAVLRLQTAFRKRKLHQKLQVKRTKRASLPMFSALTTNKKYY